LERGDLALRPTALPNEPRGLTQQQ